MDDVALRLDGSSLSTVPREFTNEIVTGLLAEHGANPPKKGELADLVAELSRGEAMLCTHKGQPCRVVDEVLICITAAKPGEVLIMLDREKKSKLLTCGLPGVRLMAGQDMFESLCKVVEENTPWENDTIRIPEGKVTVYERWLNTDSSVPTLCRKHVAMAEVVEESVVAAPPCRHTVVKGSAGDNVSPDELKQKAKGNNKEANNAASEKDAANTAKGDQRKKRPAATVVNKEEPMLAPALGEAPAAEKKKPAPAAPKPGQPRRSKVGGAVPRSSLKG